MRRPQNLCGGLLVIVALLLASCAPGEVTETTPDEAAPVVDAQVAFDLEAWTARFEEEFNAGNLEALAGMFTEDGCRMPPNQPIVEGRTMLLAQLEASTQMSEELRITPTASEVFGTTAVGRGIFERLNADGSTKETGKWMNIHKLVDGVWKMHCDIFNSDMPLDGSN